MATSATATLDANSEECGPIDLFPGKTASFHIVVTGTITVTLQRKVGTLAYVTAKKPDGEDAAYTASDTGLIEGPGSYKLVASGVSGGNAVCSLFANE